MRRTRSHSTSCYCKRSHPLREANNRCQVTTVGAPQLAVLLQCGFHCRNNPTSCADMRGWRFSAWTLRALVHSVPGKTLRLRLRALQPPAAVL